MNLWGSPASTLALRLCFFSFVKTVPVIYRVVDIRFFVPTHRRASLCVCDVLASFLNFEFIYMWGASAVCASGHLSAHREFVYWTLFMRHKAFVLITVRVSFIRVNSDMLFILMEIGVKKGFGEIFGLKVLVTPESGFR